MQPHICSRSVLLKFFEKLHEPVDQVALGEDQIDRVPKSQPLRKFIDPFADSSCMPFQLVVGGIHQVSDADADQDAVDRLMAAVLFQDLQEGRPFFLIVLLGQIAAGRVEDDGGVGKPPVAVACAADPWNFTVRPDGKFETGIAYRR